MILNDAREHYYFHTGKVSDIVRQLGLGAIAIIWIFRSSDTAALAIPSELMTSLKLVVVGLGLDLLQYAFGAALWGSFQWHLEKSGKTETEEFKAPRWINWPALACFWLKVLTIACAYLLLLKYLAKAISAGV
jgi:hypothetical protein